MCLIFYNKKPKDLWNCSLFWFVTCILLLYVTFQHVTDENALAAVCGEDGQGFGGSFSSVCQVLFTESAGSLGWRWYGRTYSSHCRGHLSKQQQGLYSVLTCFLQVIMTISSAASVLHKCVDNPIFVCL